MNKVKIDKTKALKKWSPILENMGVTAPERVDWMSEYAEYHTIHENAYANLGNFDGMGAVKNPIVAANPGNALGVSDFGPNAGSGDYGQQLLPVAMKIAAQTIGLDLVSVKPTPGPKIDLMYIDFAYDDNTNTTNERPQVFKANFSTEANTVKTWLNGVLTATGVTETVGGLSNRVYLSLAGAATNPGDISVAQATAGPGSGTKQGWVEFLGFSRIDLLPMFRLYRQSNVATTTSSNAWGFDATKNTLATNEVLTTVLESGFNNVTGVTFSYGSGTPSCTVELISALEDHIPQFTSNFESDKYPMSREAEETLYPGIIAPRVQSKSIKTGELEISTALKRTEIEDIKANLGIDIVQKMESILVNELSQTISKQIVSKIYEMGELNRQSAPGYNSVTPTAVSTVFDLDVDTYTTNISGETSHAAQRKLITKILHASNYIATEGRVGPAQFVVTNGLLGAAMADIAGYTINPAKSSVNAQGQLYPMGTIGNVQIYVDPYQRYDNKKMLIGRKNNPDQPGIVFVPYLMAQSISIISEATFAPRMLLRSRFAIAELGWYPQKQYMSILVNDTKNVLA